MNITILISQRPSIISGLLSFPHRRGAGKIIRPSPEMTPTPSLLSPIQLNIFLCYTWFSQVLVYAGRRSAGGKIPPMQLSEGHHPMACEALWWCSHLEIISVPVKQNSLVRQVGPVGLVSGPFWSLIAILREFARDIHAIIKASNIKVEKTHIWLRRRFVLWYSFSKVWIWDQKLGISDWRSFDYIVDLEISDYTHNENL